ncbi:MAG: Rrf2 family transcriptional regulator [Phycisphaerales bacterium]
MFSQTTEYALRAMAWLAVLDGDLVPTPHLAARIDVPPNYLAKVLQQLSTAKLIVGRRGVGGGYRLSRPADEITLLEIVRCIGPVERLSACPLSHHGGANGRLCPLHEATDKAAAAVIDVLGKMTLAELQRDPRRPLCAAKSARVVVPA